MNLESQSLRFWGWGVGSLGKRSIIFSLKHVLLTKRIVQWVSSVLTAWKDTWNYVFSFYPYIRKVGGYHECMGICSHAGYRPDAVSHLGEPERKREAQHGTEQACAASNSEGLSGHLSPLLKFIVFYCFSHSLDLPFIYLMSKPLEMKGHYSPREPQSGKNSKTWQTMPHRLIKRALGIFTLRLNRPEQGCQNSGFKKNFKTYYKKTPIGHFKRCMRWEVQYLLLEESLT